ncbi:MAG: SRPBCC family protein [Desulfoferrobacter sp.]
MISMESTLIVKSPIQDVFDLISDIINYGTWVPNQSNFFIENKITSEGPFGLGTTYIDRLKWWGKSTGEVTEYSPPFRVGFQQTTSFGFRIFKATAHYTLKDLNNKTEVNHKFDAKFLGIFKILESLFSPMIRQERSLTCKAIKRTLENRTP